ncbi:MAG: efflux RND transporter permease subunit [Phycisphaerae bacterium]|nr:efflux RND transporter permease subunit [Phycisphaerae bacterium]
MLNRLVHFSLRFRGVILALACALAGYGIYSFTQAQYDVFPEFAPPTVSLQAEAPGLAPEQVERLVTQPVENALNGVEGIEALRSQSIQGLGLITVTFRSGSDIYRARQVIAERLATVAGQLPQGVPPPVMTPLTSSTSVLLVAGLTSERRSLMELRTLADWTIKQRLLSVPGVAKVAVFGGEVRQFQVQVQPERVVAYDLALDDVLAAAQRATAVRGAGFLENDSQRIVLLSEGQSLTAEQLARSVVRQSQGALVRLGDLGPVVEAPEPPVGAAAIMGKPGVVLVVSSQFGANTLEVTRKVEQALADLKPALEAQDVVLHSDLFRPANFIQTSTHNVQSSLLIGAVLVVAVLMLFLFNLRTAAISCSAIPLSLLAAVILLQRLGFSLNTMTLGGLAIAIGEVVDDAVIDVENILRRLRENRRLPEPLSAFRVVLNASIEVRSAVVYATLAVILVFVPILTMSGLAGRLFAPLGVAYILAILASLLVALTVTPALCLVLLGGQQVAEVEPPVVRRLKARYVGVLQRVETNSKKVLLAVVVFTGVGLAALPFLGGGFLPELNEGHFIVHMSAVPGTSLNASLAWGRQVTQALLKLPFVRSVSQNVGRAELADDTWGTHYSEFNVDLKPLAGEEAEAAQSQVRRALAEFPGVNFAVKTFLTERVEETLSGYTASVVINIFGPDLDALDAKAKEIARLLNTVPGAADVQVQSPPGTPQLILRLKPAALARWGFNAVRVLDGIRTAYQGTTVGQVYEGNRVFNVSVILDSASRRQITQVAALPMKSPGGVHVPLGQLADIYQAAGRYVVLHEGAQRVQTITCNVGGRDVTTFVADAQRRIQAEIKLPPASYLKFGGTAAGQARSRRDLFVHSLLAALGITLLLSIVMGSERNLLLVLLNLPFALVGGVLAVFGFGGMLSLGALVGFVTLFGITLRNSIMMISHYEHLVAVEGQTWGPETALRGASERLAPILMTALVTGLGLLPLALGTGEAGREIEGPMAIVILGGLVTSTVLNLFVLPTLALRYGRFVPREATED